MKTTRASLLENMALPVGSRLYVLAQDGFQGEVTYVRFKKKKVGANLYNFVQRGGAQVRPTGRPGQLGGAPADR